ncbi:MAG: hypothetical protein A2137_08020 [Chloroflexi bacterium RBG_16_58_8]|nr:MAG: hypothetical protein A2137_08020 [Chloroflexi bacterium RBG_16_58_8]
MKNKRFIAGLVLIMTLLAVFPFTGAALAQDEAASTVTLTTEFPRIDGTAADTFPFTVALNYKGDQNRVFEVATTPPAGWNAYVTPQFDSQRISSILIDSSFTGVTKSLKVTVNGPTFPPALPGEYKITLRVSSEDVVGTIELIARVTPRGILSAAPANQDRVYSTRATAGRDNLFGIAVANVGTSAIENVTFTPESKPEGWEITFQPENLETLEVLASTAVDVNIKPPPNTMAGDYMFSLRVTGKDVPDSVKMDIRVTVQTPTIWGWVGVAIIIIVVVSLFVIFMRFGRR